MKFEHFIRALQSTSQKDFSYSIKDINLTESRPKAKSINKDLSCSFVATYEFGKAKIVLTQGVSIDYYSTDGMAFNRKSLVRVDYLDNILLNGINRIPNGSFDLVFLLDQLENQEVYKNVNRIVTLMFSKVIITDKKIIELLTKAFDNYILAMPNVHKLITQDSREKLIEQLINLKMSEVAPVLQKSKYQIDGLKLEKTTSMHKFISGYVTSYFRIDDFSFTATYYMERKYPVHVDNNKSLYINDTSFDKVQKLKIEAKTGELILDLANKEASVVALEGNSALFYKLQSVFGLIKRGNSLVCVTDVFDQFYSTVQHHKATADLANLETHQLTKKNDMSKEIEEDGIIDLISEPQKQSTHTRQNTSKSNQMESPIAPRLNHMFWRPFYYPSSSKSDS